MCPFCVQNLRKSAKILKPPQKKKYPDASFFLTDQKKQNCLPVFGETFLLPKIHILLYSFKIKCNRSAMPSTLFLSESSHGRTVTLKIVKHDLQRCLISGNQGVFINKFLPCVKALSPARSEAYSSHGRTVTLKIVKHDLQRCLISGNQGVFINKFLPCVKALSPARSEAYRRNPQRQTLKIVKHDLQRCLISGNQGVFINKFLPCVKALSPARSEAYRRNPQRQRNVAVR